MVGTTFFVLYGILGKSSLVALSLLQMLRQKRNAYSLLIFSINAVTLRSGVAHEVHTRSTTWLSSTRS